jgi:serine/threonine-protein kinase
MSAVYKARHEKTNRAVAVKMSPGGPESRPGDGVRIRREAALLGALPHPNIVRLLEAGEHEGRPFFTTEWLPGGSLADRLGRGPLPLLAVLRMGEALGHALHYIHERRILHLDLRPSNILFSRAGRAKLIDFGVAKRLHKPHGLTRRGGACGDPRYIAPEEAGGPNTRVGPGTDIHALGAILYEALTGRPPFQDVCLRDRLRRTRVVVRPPSAFRAGLPAAMDRICLRCLQTKPELRYATAGAFAGELWSVLDGLRGGPETPAPCGRGPNEPLQM